MIVNDEFIKLHLARVRDFEVAMALYSSLVTNDAIQSCSFEGDTFYYKDTPLVTFKGMNTSHQEIIRHYE